MRLLSRILGIVPREERDGIRLTDTECWRVAPVRDAALYFRALLHLLTPEAVLYLEGSTESSVPAFARAHPADRSPQLAVGTIWPYPDRYHVPASAGNVSQLADVIEQHRIALPAIHTHLYEKDAILAEWFDAFTDDPIYVASSYPEDTVRLFAERLRREYTGSVHAV